MITCDRCGEEIPKGKHGAQLLDCPRCLSVKSYRELLNFHQQYIGRMLDGSFEVKLTKPAERPTWHMALSEGLAWCGEGLSGQWKQKQRLAYRKIDPVKTPVCESCQRVFKETAEKAAAGAS